MKPKKKIYSHDLGIDLSSKKESELFKWFLACLLFGKPIQQEVAKRTYFEFEKEKLTSPAAICIAGWQKLVDVLDRGHYVRYDYSTATRLLSIMKALKNTYGSVTALIQRSKTEKNLSKKLQEFSGVGPITARIFVRDVNQYYGKNYL